MGRARHLAVVLWLGTLAATGCGPNGSWVYTFVEAENAARRAEKPIFIFYRDPFDPLSGRMLDLLDSPEIRRMTRDMIQCSLVTEYDPNRRFVAQYGITSAPGVIVVHSDGTFHSRQGSGDLTDITTFLSQAQPPGEAPRVDIQIPRPTDFLLRAEGDFEKALNQAKRQNRTLLVVYKWWLDTTSTELIRNMSRPQVAARCTEMVVCLLDWDYAPNREYVSRFGVTQYPAIILVQPDGTASTRQGATTTEQIVGFITQSLSRQATG